MSLNVFLSFFSLRLVFNFNPCGQRKSLIWFQSSWICWGLFCVLPCGLYLKMFHVHLKKMCILLLLDERGLYMYHLCPFDLGHCSMPQYLCWYFVLKIYLWQWGVKILYYNCVAVNILKSSKIFFYVFGCSYVRCIFIYNFYVFLLDSSFEYYEVTFWVSFYGPFWSLFCVIWVLLPQLFFFPCPFAWNICFQPFFFSLCRSFVLSWVSWMQYMHGSRFLIHSTILCFDWGI